MDYLRLGSREDLERLILKKLAETKRAGVSSYFVNYDRIADQLETSDQGVVDAWVFDFSDRYNLLNTKHNGGVSFCPLIP